LCRFDTSTLDRRQRGRRGLEPELGSGDPGSPGEAVAQRLPGKDIGLLWQVGDCQRRRIQRDGPAVGCLLARKQAQDRRLPDAVRADEADAGVRADLEGGILEHDLSSVGLRDAGEAGAHDGVTS
jgi:hypothetical protein